MTALDVARRYWVYESAGDLEGVVSCFAEDAQFVTAQKTWTGLAEIRDRYSQAMAVTSRLQVFMGNELLDGDRASIRWAAIFHPHQGSPYGLVGVNLITILGNKFIRIECFYDETPLDPKEISSRWAS